MNQKILLPAQLFLRIAVSISFLSAVADRFGLWGAPGSKNVSWGNWQNFVEYSNMVNSFVGPKAGEGLAILATALEIMLPILLLLGYKVRIAAMLSAALLLSFALAMTISFGVKPSLDYSVWTGAAACLLLSGINTYQYSLDSLFKKQYNGK